MFVAVLAAIGASVGIFIGLEAKLCDVIEDRSQGLADDMRGGIAIINDEYAPLDPDLHIYVKNIGSRPLVGEVTVFMDGRRVKIDEIRGTKTSGDTVAAWGIGATIDIEVDFFQIVRSRDKDHLCEVMVAGVTDDALIRFI